MADLSYDVARAVIATYRLARLDVRAVELFGRTPQEAWASLRLLGLSLPLIMFLSGPEAAYIEGLSLSPFAYATVMAEHAVISLIGFYLIMYRLTGLLGAQKNYAHFVCVMTSTTLPVTLVVTLVIGLARFLNISPETGQIVGMCILAFQVLVDWVATYATLKVKPIAAFAICVMGVLFSRVVYLFLLLSIMMSSPVQLAATP